MANRKAQSKKQKGHTTVPKKSEPKVRKIVADQEGAVYGNGGEMVKEYNEDDERCEPYTSHAPLESEEPFDTKKLVSDILNKRDGV